MPEIRKKCEDTCFELYGKHSWDFAIENIQTENTNIEIKFENFLNNEKIEYKKQYKFVYDTKNFRYKIFDFYLPKYNLLIEIDGDYWHGNPLFFKKLNETQKHNIKNDVFKNELAKQNGFKLLRIWGNELYKDSFKNDFIEWLK